MAMAVLPRGGASGVRTAFLFPTLQRSAMKDHSILQGHVYACYLFQVLNFRPRYSVSLSSRLCHFHSGSMPGLVQALKVKPDHNTAVTVFRRADGCKPMKILQMRLSHATPGCHFNIYIARQTFWQCRPAFSHTISIKMQKSKIALLLRHTQRILLLKAAWVNAIFAFPAIARW